MDDEDVFSALKDRRQDEENALDFQEKLRKELHFKCAQNYSSFANNEYAQYLLKRVRRPADPEIELKSRFKKAFGNKQLFAKNRALRNEEYVAQRKKDFAISQERVKQFIEKIKDEYEKNVQEYLKRCNTWNEKTEVDSKQLISDITQRATDLICQTASEFSDISDALSFIPTFYQQIISLYHAKGITFNKESELIPDLETTAYFTSIPLRPDITRLYVTLQEACKPSSMTPQLISRKGRAVCILTKPLVLNQEQCSNFAQSLGWVPIFATDYQVGVPEIFKLLSETEQDLMIFGFPRTPSELEEITKLFNPITQEGESEKYLPSPIPSHVEPFDLIIELDIHDETILRDVLAEFEDTDDGSRYDVRNLFIDTETQIVRLQPVPDPCFDIVQFPSRSVTLKTNFNLIMEHYPKIFTKLDLEERDIGIETEEQIQESLNAIQPPIQPSYAADAIYPALIECFRSKSEELRTFYMDQWEMIENNYQNTVHKIYELLNSTHLSLIRHLEKGRAEMQQFLSRPGSSQHLVIEFQQWHCSQVERCMRKMQKVKDECNLRLNSLRESLIQIENDRKTEEESKQKDLLNAPFRSTLFEIVNNACTMLAQAEFDKWASTRMLMLDYNQVLSDGENIVNPPLHKKLTMVVDPSRANVKKGAKKPARVTPTSRNRVDNKLQPFETNLYDQLENLKKTVQEAAVMYIRTTTPVSTRGKARVVKDKNPFANHKITALDEFSTAFTDDDKLIVERIDQIAEIARDEIHVVQQSFDAYVEDSSQWIQTHYERRKSIADTAVAYMMQKVQEESQINQLIFLQEDQCAVDFTKLLVANEESPKIPPPFPEQTISDVLTGSAEQIMQQIVDFEAENAAQQ